MTTRVPGTETTPDVRDLRAFCLVVDLGSVTAAASRLQETKGSVSRRLSRLEESLGVSLLRRSPRIVQPTEDGAAYRARIGRVLELLDDAGSEVRGARDAPRGNLRVTAPNDLAVSMLGPVLARFVERFPEVTVDMLLTEKRLDFDSEQIDVAFRASAALEDSSLVAHKLRDLDGRLFASRAYLKKHGAPAAPEDLASHRVLVMGALRAARTIPLRRASDTTPSQAPIRVAMSASDAAFVREVAVAGAGIAVLPSEIVERDVEQGRLVPVLADHLCFSGTLHLVHQGARFLPPKVRAFRDHVLSHFGRSPRARRG
jgi:DNA-binding transcriptional LysR family regulator